MKQSIGLGRDYVVGFIGSLTEYEGVDLIIAAVSELRTQGYPIQALVVGKGHFEAKLHSLRNKMPEKACIHFSGHIPYKHILRYYSIIDCCAYPRKDLEVCQLVPPLKILEAMVMCKPVVVSALPPLLESVVDGETGVVCEPNNVDSLANKIKYLIDNRERAKNIAENGREWGPAKP